LNRLLSQFASRSGILRFYCQSFEKGKNGQLKFGKAAKILLFVCHTNL